jgi:hypothetical protein
MASYDNDVLVDMGDYDSFSSSSDEKLFQRMQRVHQMVFIIAIANTNTLDFVQVQCTGYGWRPID